MTRRILDFLVLALAVPAFFFLWLWVSEAIAAAPPLPLRHADVQLELGHTPLSVMSARSIPGRVDVYFDVSFNGERAQMIWSDSRWDLEYAWRGVIVSISTRAWKLGPYMVRAASVRHDVVHVFVRSTWRPA